jgi:hypothetical protein
VGLVPAETYTRRIAACQTCEHYVAPTEDVLHLVGRLVLGDDRVCARCGCFMSLKARFALSHCPEPDPHDGRLDRWGERRSRT